jgi:hypothetical protein
MPPRTLLLAGGRPAAIAFAATPLQWTTAFSLEAGADAGHNAVAAADAIMSVRTRSLRMSRLLVMGEATDDAARRFDRPCDRA